MHILEGGKNNMIASFVQTYWNNRNLLRDILFEDKNLQKFLNLFDLNIYSFQDSNDQTVQYFVDRNPIKNTKILRFNGMPYTHCVDQVIKMLEEMNCTHLFFHQDDTFSVDNDDFDFEKFLEFVTQHNENFMVCVAQSYDMMLATNQIKKIDENILFTSGNNAVIESNSFNYIWPQYCMNDDAFIATFDMVKKVYDESYIRIGDISVAEGHLHERFKKEKIVRHIMKKQLFKNYNMIGRNTDHKHTAEMELRNKKLLK